MLPTKGKKEGEGEEGRGEKKRERFAITLKNVYSFL